MTTAELTEIEDFALIVREYAERDDIRHHPTAIAEAILEDDPNIFSKLPHSTRVRILKEAVSDHYSSTPRVSSGIRSQRVRVEGEHEPRIRISAGGQGAWDVRWKVGETYLQTRELSKSDLEYLIRDRNQHRIALAAQMKWLMSCLSMAREYAVDNLGQLEKRGVKLPEFDSPESEV